MISNLEFFRNFSKKLPLHLAVTSLAFNQFIFISQASAQALPIVVDGTTNTIVTHTDSGIDQINIAAPNANGVSHNNFTDYNINQSGQIINNFSGRNSAEFAAGSASGRDAVTQTQIGGLVAVNNNLAESGSARVILSEVTSNNISQFLGYAEVAGTKADLIFVNPNGIICAGCGFINTAHLLMVGGSTNYDANGNLGFELTKQDNPNLYAPIITIDGLGLDATKVSSTDIVASSVKLLATIYADKDASVSLRAGEGRYNYATKEIAASSGEGAKHVSGKSDDEDSKPVFAIDASNLAKIQAGRVYLIATKEGVGVNMASEILASKQVNISANGDIFYDKIQAGEAVEISSNSVSGSGSTHNISSLNSGSIIAAPTLTLQANGEVKNLGLLTANNLTINGSSFTNEGLIKAFSNLKIDANNFTNSGNVVSDQGLEINIAQDFANVGNVFANNEVKISAKNIINGTEDWSLFANIASLNSSLTINVENSFINRGLSEIYSAGKLTINSKNLTNDASHILTDDALVLTIAGSLDNINGSTLQSVKKLSLTAANFYNFGAVRSRDEAEIAADTIGSVGYFYSAGNLTVTANGSKNLLDPDPVASLKTDGGQLFSLAKIKITTKDSDIGGYIMAADDINISSTGKITTGWGVGIDSLKSITINSASSFENKGVINADKNLFITANSINNYEDAIIQINGEATLIANNFTVNSYIAAGGKINISENNKINPSFLLPNLGENIGLNFINNNLQYIADNAQNVNSVSQDVAAQNSKENLITDLQKNILNSSDLSFIPALETRQEFTDSGQYYTRNKTSQPSPSPSQDIVENNLGRQTRQQNEKSNETLEDSLRKGGEIAKQIDESSKKAVLIAQSKVESNIAEIASLTSFSNVVRFLNGGKDGIAKDILLLEAVKSEGAKVFAPKIRLVKDARKNLLSNNSVVASVSAAPINPVVNDNTINRTLVSDSESISVASLNNIEPVGIVNDAILLSAALNGSVVNVGAAKSFINLSETISISAIPNQTIINKGESGVGIAKLDLKNNEEFSLTGKNNNQAGAADLIISAISGAGGFVLNVLGDVAQKLNPINEAQAEIEVKKTKEVE